MEEFNINDMIHDAVQNVENLLSDKGISVSVELGKNKGDEMRVYGESQLLYRVFYNLLTNAIKFTPLDGIIQITTGFEPKENKVYVTIEDSGSGIPEDKLDRVFESFYKVDPSRTESGFGLGLYICREIITAHGEKIWAESGSELGGAKFIYTLPAPEDLSSDGKSTEEKTAPEKKEKKDETSLKDSKESGKNKKA